MKYIYHYYAIHQPQPGVISHIDGTIEKSESFQSAEDFAMFRKGIAERNGLDPGNLTICSITLISGIQP